MSDRPVTPSAGAHPDPEAAPFFRAPTSKGQTIDSDAFVGKLAVLLFFVPTAEDDEGGLATIREFDETLSEFGHLRVQLLGVVPWTARDARRRAEDLALSVTLLADEDRSIARAFGFDGRGGAVVVDRYGAVARQLDDATDGHLARDALAEIRHLHDEHHDLVAPMA